MGQIINCDKHGENEGCMICQHLITKKDLGFARILVVPEDHDYETAMCAACESLLLKENDWSDKVYNFSDFKIFCRVCYEDVLNNHTLIAEGGMK